MTENLKGKKLLILGGNPETGVLVEVANNLGILTIVVDPNSNSPAKKYAYKSFDYDGFDIDKIVLLAKKEKVDGVLVGVADILVNPYQLICDKLNLPCYATKKIVNALCSKDGFRKACIKHKIKDIPGFYIDSITKLETMGNLSFPVMVKPVDNGAGVGMRICDDKNELIDAVSNALKMSKKGGVLVERYMTGDDMFAYYTIKDGNVFLSALADRITTKKQGSLSPVCIGAVYPSKYTNFFTKYINPKMIDFFKKLGIKNGILNIQFFIDNDEFYAYDPGFRLQGEAPHLHIAKINGFDHRKMLINFSLNGNLGINDFEEKNDFLFKGKYAVTLWVLLNSGIIGEIEGINKIKRDNAVSYFLQRFKEKDFVSPEMIGTERQVFARIYLQCKKFEDLKNKVVELRKMINIKDVNGNDMIIDWMSTEQIFNYKLNNS